MSIAVRCSEMGVTHVVAAFDGSDSARGALADAAAIAQEWGARLTVLALAPTERPARCCNLQTTSWNAEMRRLAAGDLRRARSLLDGVDAEFVMREGCGRRALARAAEQLGGDLLVQGGRRHTRRRALLSR